MRNHWRAGVSHARRRGFSYSTLLWLERKFGISCSSSTPFCLFSSVAGRQGSVRCRHHRSLRLVRSHGILRCRRSGRQEACLCALLLDVLLSGRFCCCCCCCCSFVVATGCSVHLQHIVLPGGEWCTLETCSQHMCMLGKFFGGHSF